MRGDARVVIVELDGFADEVHLLERHLQARVAVQPDDHRAARSPMLAGGRSILTYCPVTMSAISIINFRNCLQN